MQRNLTISLPNAAYIFGDMRDEAVLRKALEGVEVIFHLASAVGVGQSMYEIERYVEVTRWRLQSFSIGERGE